MNKLKKGIALFLCTVLCIPSIPAAAESRQKSTGDAVKFNTGSYEYCVVEEDTVDGLWNEFVKKYGDDDSSDPAAAAAKTELGHYVAWEPDGSYEIAVEQDAFFPYEVQFTYDGKTDREWFMTEDSTVEVAGHTFRLDVPKASGDVVTRMELNAGKDTVIVYPEAKNFINDESSKESAASLIPLKEKRFRADLSVYTPAETKKITFRKLLVGQEELPKGTSVMWKTSSSTDIGYHVSTLDNVYDLSSRYFEMIVGEKDQLEMQNIRYIINGIDYPDSDWLTASLSREQDGITTKIDFQNVYLRDDYLSASFYGTEEKKYYIKLGLSDDYIEKDKHYDAIKVFEGVHTEDELVNATEITDDIWQDAGGAGYQTELDWGSTFKYFTIATYKDNQVTGCLPITMNINKNKPRAYVRNSTELYSVMESGSKVGVVDDYDPEYIENVYEYTFTLKDGYAADASYTTGKFYYSVNGVSQNDFSAVKAYVGKYDSSASAQAESAREITNDLFGNGYTADFSGGVTFSIFYQLEGEEHKEYYRYKTEKYKPTADVRIDSGLYSVTESGTSIYVVDDYEYNFERTEGVHEYIYTLKEGYAANASYTTGKFQYYVNNILQSDFSSVKAYLGKYDSSASAQAQTAAEITSDLFGTGYTADFSEGVTFSIFYQLEGEEQKVYYRYKAVKYKSTATVDPATELYPVTESDLPIDNAARWWDDEFIDGVNEYTFTLKEGYAANARYTTGKFRYYVNHILQSDFSSVRAYLGKYDSIASAQAQTAAEITNDLFGAGYTADFSGGVTFSIFYQLDGEEQKVYYCFKTVEGTSSEPVKNSDAWARFTGVVIPKPGRSDENITVPSYILNTQYDSYGDGKFYTIFVDKKVELEDGEELPVDLKSLALEFSVPDGAKMYVEGQEGTEESGKSFHDFSEKAVHFAVTSEDGQNHKNYFVRIFQVKTREDAAANPAQLYINSLDDSASNTSKNEQGVVSSTREVFLDSYHDNVHDILVSNVGCTTMSALKVELTDAADMELDEYWTLQGINGLSGLSSIERSEDTPNAQLANLAVVRLNPKQGELEAKEYGKLGTLTFTSDKGTQIVLTLTGIVGDPRIVTKEIKNPTKYVPYGIMIMDNNKYDINHVSYSCTGKLPDGMTFMPSGELYGVPKEAGDFEITVTMHNSYDKFSDDTKTYKFTVLENTDDFVNQAQDEGYELVELIDNIDDVEQDGNYLIVSSGEYGEYTDLYIDGVKKQRGTDYEAESGSTRITIMAQSLPKSEGTHTIGVEFRKDKSQGKVRAAAQNYHVAKKNPGGSSSGGSSSSGGGSSSGGSSSSGSGSSTGNKPNTGNKPDNTDTGNTSQPGGSSGQPGGSTSQPAVNDPKPDGTDISNGKNTTVSKLMLYARTYAVQDGDTLKSLAKKFYGKSSKWKKIYSANKEKFTSSRQLKKGMKLQIPAVSYTVKKGDTIKSIAKKYFGANSKWKLIYQVNQDVVTSSLKIKAGQKLVLPIPVVCRIYTVKKGDSLEKIAKKFYGRSSKWQKIYNANKNKVSKSNKVKTGTNLFIPAMTYKVKKGDDIKSIAKNYYGARSEWRQIYDANKDIIPSSKKLKAGETLVLPVPVDIG